MYIFNITFKNSDWSREDMVKSVHYSAGVISVIHMDDTTEIINFAEVASYTFKREPDQCKLAGLAGNFDLDTLVRAISEIEGAPQAPIGNMQGRKCTCPPGSGCTRPCSRATS